MVDDVAPNVKKIRGLNLPGTPWATSACCGRTLVTCFEYYPTASVQVFEVAIFKNSEYEWSLRIHNKRKPYY